MEMDVILVRGSDHVGDGAAATLRIESALNARCTYQQELEAKVSERTREIEETKQYLENLLEMPMTSFIPSIVSSASPMSARY